VTRRQDGQATIELVVGAMLVAALALGGVDVLRALRAHDAAERAAARAAVLVAERRPIPDSLRQGVQLQVKGDAVRAVVHTCAMTAGIGCFDVGATVHVP
jgi:Flp pilus assembly protein TadG